MKPLIAFVLATFNAPEQTAFLCSKLSRDFGNPLIAIHHDFGQSPLSRHLLPANVRLVEDWHPTRWGHISVINAVIKAVRLLHTFADPDWTVSLSTACYPVLAADAILAGLQSTEADVLMDHREILAALAPLGHQRDPANSFNDPEWMEFAYNRYAAVRTPAWLSSLPGFPKEPQVLRGRRIEKILTPFNPSFRPYGGDSWFSFNRRAAQAFLNDSPRLETCLRHFSRRPIPEEGFYQTLLCNTPGLTIASSNKRYTDWSGGGKSPKVLGHEDIPRIIASGAHFARKFPFDPELYAVMDEAVRRAALK